MKELKREQDGWCGPSTLEWVARQEGIKTTQSKLAELMQTTNKDGTNHTQMLMGAREIGLKAFQLQGLGIEVLGKLLNHHHIIVNWMDGDNEEDDGHYSVLEEVRDGKVCLNEVTMSVDDFEKKWYDVEGGKRISNWALVVCKGNSEATLYGKRRYDYKL